MAALAPAAAEGLVASLARAQAELDWIRLRLEEEFARSCRKGEINTLALLTRLNKLRRCGGRRAAGVGLPGRRSGGVSIHAAAQHAPLFRASLPCSELPEIQEECHRVLQAKQALVDAVKQGLGANTDQLRKVGARLARLV